LTASCTVRTQLTEETSLGRVTPMGLPRIHDCPTSVARLRGSLETGGHRLLEASYAPNSSIEEHSHANASWAFVLRGDFRSITSSGTRECSAHHLGHLGSGAAHADAYGREGAMCLIIEHRHQDLLARRAASSITPISYFGAGTPAAGVAFLIYKEFRIRDDLAADAIQGLILALCAVAARDAGPPIATDTVNDGPAAARAGWLERLRDQLRDEFLTPLRIDALAEGAGVHPVYLARAFRQAYGCSPTSFVRNLRIEWAKGRLVHSLESISTIALRAGYSDQSHFTHCFRRAVGTTPAAFRMRSTDHVSVGVRNIGD
jgi:AraC family transcriptional regulator